jgi:hypothetical protein
MFVFICLCINIATIVELHGMARTQQFWNGESLQSGASRAPPYSSELFYEIDELFYCDNLSTSSFFLCRILESRTKQVEVAAIIRSSINR